MDKIDFSRNGIKHINVIDFLMAEDFNEIKEFLQKTIDKLCKNEIY